MLTCTICGRRNYLNAKPAAGVLILQGGWVLLVRRSIEPFKGYWDIPGGFLGPRELPEAAARREIEEETGLQAHGLSFLGFYLDDYDYQGQQYVILNIYFVAEATGEPRAGDDASDVGWFSLDALPPNIAFVHARQVLADLQSWVKTHPTGGRTREHRRNP